MKPPKHRSVEPDWLDAQSRPLKQIRRLWQELQHPMVLFCGDLFDRWGTPPELINWAIENFPVKEMISIPGNHDLPSHSLDEIRRSGYWTLNAAGLIVHLDDCWPMDGSCIWPHLWGDKTTRPIKNKQELDIVMVHEYCHGPKGSAYKDAPESQNAKYLARRFKGYDIVLVGDNHHPFFWYPDEEDSHTLPIIVNNGGLQRRTILEISHRPRVNLLYADGFVKEFELDCSEDKFIDIDDTAKIVERASDVDMTEVLDALKKLGEDGLDFVAAVRRLIKDNNIEKQVVKRIFAALEG